MDTPTKKAPAYARVYHSLKVALSHRANILCLVVFFFASASVIGTYQTNPPYVTVCGVLAAAGSACAGFKKARRPDSRDERFDLESCLVSENLACRIPTACGTDDGDFIQTMRDTGTDRLSIQSIDATTVTSAAAKCTKAEHLEVDITDGPVIDTGEFPVASGYSGAQAQTVDATSTAIERASTETGAPRQSNTQEIVHRRIVQAQWQGDPVCPTCSASFTRKEYLEGHLKRHYDKREYACLEESCTQRFNTRRNLRSHMRRRHRT